MAQENSNSTMEMGTSDQVLVASKRKKTLTYVIGCGIMLLVVGVVITLVVVLSGNEGGSVAEPIVSSTEGPTPISTPPTSPLTSPVTEPPVDPVDPTEPPTDPLPTDPPPTDPTSPPTPAPDPVPQETELDLESIINGDFSPSSFNATWHSGNEVYFRDAYGNLVLYEVDTDAFSPLIANTSTLLQQSSRVTQLNADGDKIVLAHDVIPEFRYSFQARYTVVDMVHETETEIRPPGGARSDVTRLQNFLWGPSGSSLAFVYMNNIYYQASLDSEPETITTTGDTNVIYHGIPDWVYEEEVFSSNNAMWFSEDGSKLAYATFDDTEVRKMRVPHYGVPGSVAFQYTVHDEIRYPKPGTENPIVSVTLRDLGDGIDTTYNAPLANLNQPILKAVQFVTNNTIAIMWTNRVQTELRVDLCTFNSTCSTIFTYNEPNGWIDNIPMMFNAEGSSFITILPQAVGGSRFKQVVQVTKGTTEGPWALTDRTITPHTVLEILLWTPENVIWYKATHVADSAQQHIYTVNASGNVACFSCDIVREDGGSCEYNEAVISEGGNRIALNCAGPNIPQTYIYKADGTLVRTWDSNAELSTLVEHRTLPRILRIPVQLVANMPPATVQVQVPPDYESRTNIPLLVYVYGGPDTALVTKQWNIDWGTSLVNRYGIAVAYIDGRGSGLKGVDNLFAVNRKLGTVEIEDQIEVTRFLQNNYGWVDRNRTCIWGWSYGGYAASLALARGKDVFRCAAAVAPVVDWHFYDTIYTERYMDLPQNNALAYAASSLLVPAVADAYRDKRYMLIHGTADDNVHFQHAMLISRMLQRQDVQFTQMAYTDEDHGLVGVRPHLYHGLERFLKENMF